MREILHDTAIECSTDSYEAFKPTRATLQVQVCGPAESPPVQAGREPWRQEEIVVLYLGGDDAENDGAEIKVRAADLRAAITEVDR